ncbi:MAG TPA: histidine kinase [Solirubrobacter sp.]|nr:histidine kinase [Solirubrobacter sp.]
MSRLIRHSLVADLALPLVLLGVCFVGAPEGQLWTVGMIVPLVWRRRAPFLVFCVISAVAFGHWLADVNLTADVALLVAVYSVAVHEPRGRLIAACAILGVGIVLAVARWAEQAELPALLLLTGLATAAVVLGLNVRTRRAYTAALEERAEQLERERDQQGRLAAAAERARIAREMHDIVAHNLSVMISLADGAGFMAEREPARSADAMERVSRTGRHALAEMRRLLGVLRDDEDTALAPQPGLADLDALLERVRAAGVSPTLETSGTPVPLGAGAELTVYRLVQEALTNTLKHAGPGARATVRLAYDADGVEVEVTDDGPGRARVSAGGQGLAGMRERAAVYGGALEAGPAPGGGWRVHARLGA